MNGLYNGMARTARHVMIVDGDNSYEEAMKEKG